MINRLLVLAVAVLVSACGANDLLGHCPGEQDCGSGCAPTSASCCPDGSHYCSSPNTCNSSNACVSGGGGGGGSSNYYVSANGCTGGATISYNGSSYTVCNTYYQAAVASHCTKILDNCR
jgi:hypothetical protein